MPRTESPSHAKHRPRHGSLPEARRQALRAAGLDVEDFSTSVNPYGPPPALIAAARNAPLRDYPDPDARPVVESLAEWLGVAPDGLVVGPGAAELLWSLSRALQAPAASAVVIEPCFSETRGALEAAGFHVHALECGTGGVDLDRLAGLVRTRAPDVVALANPSTPVGHLLGRAEWTALVEATAPATVILDESFLSLSREPELRDLELPGRFIRVRSLTKDMGLAGVRLGYLLAEPGLVERLARVRPPWSVSSSAQAVGCRVPGQDAWVESCRMRLLADRAALLDRLAELGLRALPSATTYGVLEVGHGARVAEALLAEGLVVRDCASFGLPRHVRFSTRTPAANERLASALASVHAEVIT